MLQGIIKIGFHVQEQPLILQPDLMVIIPQVLELEITFMQDLMVLDIVIIRAHGWLVLYIISKILLILNWSFIIICMALLWED